MNSLNYLIRCLLILIGFNLILTSCKNDVKEERINFFENKKITLAEKFQKVLETEYLLGLGLNEEQSLWVQEYYENRHFKPKWINDSTLTKKGEELKDVLDRSVWFGIPENRLKLTTKKKTIWIEEEVLMTARTALILSDLNNGFMNFEEKKYKPEYFVSIEYMDSLLKKKGKLPYDSLFIKLGPSDTNYRFMINKLHEYCSSYPLDKTNFEIQTIKIDSIFAIPNTKKALLSKGYLKSTDADSVTFETALKLFQVHNGLKPDAVVGANTAIALNESTYQKTLRTSLILDRMRKRTDYPERCVRINIPEFTLRFYVKDSLKRIHRIVVGKPENQTPELQSKIRNIVVYPYWNVPYSISSKEILPAAKINAGYFAKNNYKIYRNDVEINPYSVNWKKIKKNTFPYKVVQEPGPKNSLGIIKFEFHNNFSVYVHDTPSKGLFRNPVRAYSHGCMRCENPVDLGKTFLDYDSVRRKRNDFTADSLDTLLGRRKNFIIPLKNTIPIFVEYNTVFADREKLIFYLDIYKRDEEYLKIMQD